MICVFENYKDDDSFQIDDNSFITIKQYAALKNIKFNVINQTLLSFIG